LKPDIAKLLLFFPHFKPVDALMQYKVLDVVISESVVYAICVKNLEDDKSGEN
jgi:hypothetical protein